MVEPVRHRQTKETATDMFEPKATAPHLDSTATTFIITHSPSRSKRRDGFSFSEERRGPGDGPATGGVTRSIDSGGRTSFRGTSRPQVVEREATHRAISHAEIVGVPILMVHVSGREAMEQVRWARQRSLPVHAETCPQYITLTADDLKGLNMDMSGAKYLCSPPPRDKESQRRSGRGLPAASFRRFLPIIARFGMTIPRAS
jgi:hypothetical protein